MRRPTDRDRGQDDQRDFSGSTFLAVKEDLTGGAQLASETRDRRRRLVALYRKRPFKPLSLFNLHWLMSRAQVVVILHFGRVVLAENGFEIGGADGIAPSPRRVSMRRTKYLQVDVSDGGKRRRENEDEIDDVEGRDKVRGKK